MGHVFITLKGLRIDINGRYPISNDFSFYGDFRQIDSKLNKIIEEGNNARMQFILHDESRMSGYLYKRFNKDIREEPEVILDLFNDLTLYLNCLWLVADYSVIVKEGIQFNDNKHNILDFSSLTFNNSDLKLDFFYKEGELPISRTQLGHAKTYYKILKSYNTEQKDSKVEMRILRSIAFINESKKTNNPHVRIAFMVMALECLLANSKGESVTNTALKTAFLKCLFDSKSDFNEIYRFIKDCYNIRSNFVHGTIFEEKEETVKDLSKKFELLLKELIKKTLDSTDFRKRLNNSSELINDLTKSFKLKND